MVKFFYRNLIDFKARVRTLFSGLAFSPYGIRSEEAVNPDIGVYSIDIPVLLTSFQINIRREGRIKSLIPKNVTAIW
ncbi:hypothetical protein Plhal304r1_c036g0111191 [Plasmopara halstedii]